MPSAKLRPPVFWKERDAVTAQARLWTAKKLNAAYDVLWAAELRCKTAGAPQELIAADAYRERGQAGRRANTPISLDPLARRR